MSRKNVRSSSFNWTFLLLLAGVLAIGILIFLWSIRRPFCANSKSCLSDFTIENGAKGKFNGQTVMAPAIEISSDTKSKKVLGESLESGEKHIYVDLTSQTLTAKQGDSIFMTAKVSTGKWFPTPTGEFEIWYKIRATRMSGGEGADYYDLPNVPYVMFFYNDKIAAGRGFSLHGAYWHNNFGHAMSHGCVNMRTIDAKKLYEWVNPLGETASIRSSESNPGTKITIYGAAP